MDKQNIFNRFFGNCEQGKTEWIVKWASKKLDLDPEQKYKMTIFSRQFQHNMANINMARRESRNVMELLVNEGADRDKASAVLHDSMAAILTSTDEIVDAFGHFVDSLNLQQQQKLHNYIIV
jgi:Spy/CpxP family protein refolding chaperone